LNVNGRLWTFKLKMKKKILEEHDLRNILQREQKKYSTKEKKKKKTLPVRD